MTDLSLAWRELLTTADRDRGVPLAEHVSQESDRLKAMRVTAAGLTVDLSKQAWSQAGLAAALALAEVADLPTARQRLFAGEAMNASEDRAVLHMALRAPAASDFRAKGEPVMAEVDEVRRRMAVFAEAVRSGIVRGHTGLPFRHVLHIGIGGSDLGPRLVWDALRPIRPTIDLHFIANVDGSEFALTTASLDPAQTLVVVVSKTFGTQETMANAEAARAWLAAALGDAAVPSHLAAVSTALDRTAAFGVAEDRVFGFWDWVGGRFSLWSAVSLSVAIALGFDTFEALLSGARAMDNHFLITPIATNAPVLLALAQIYNRNGHDRRARSVVPYSHRLRRLPAFLQQLEMESNGKSVSAQGRPLAHGTAPVVFGDEGANVQHAYFQAMHQGTDVVPLEFIVAAKSNEGPPEMQEKLLANVLAQSEALLKGRSEAEVRDELQLKGLAPAEIDKLAPQRTFAGGRPSTLIVLEALTPHTLGALLALYEHKTFVEGIIWGINSFDQWGVELGKTLAGRILGEWHGGPRQAHDVSTDAWIARLAP